MKISALAIYPLKSGRGIDLAEAQITAHGLVGDRQLMLVSPSGDFVTQRELPALAGVSVLYDGTSYHVSFHDGRRTQTPSFIARKQVTVWRDTVDAAVADDATNQALSEWLGQPLELALFDEKARRMANEEWAGPDTPVTFTDGYQVLITNTASLAALNADMEAHGEGSVRMERFRANIVIDSDQPWAEDHWASLTIGDIAFDLVKPCTRCIMTTQDQSLGARTGPSPLAAMGRLRMSADPRVRGVLFGWNAVPRNEGTIRVGDHVQMTKTRPEGFPLKRRG